jgi:hypothetical protein
VVPSERHGWLAASAWRPAEAKAAAGHNGEGLLVMTGVRSIEAVAAGLTAAFAVGDLDQLAPLLAPDVRWGGEEDTEQTCHSGVAGSRACRVAHPLWGGRREPPLCVRFLADALLRRPVAA